ncbi:MAG: hypothetical protein HKP61_07090 [Dactylosporangium sp.]|nr:hypothetical protein [Dactylosporangium sp.]NNJ60708.1 hypothetical protein [Dactylosporangium sp.]
MRTVRLGGLLVQVTADRPDHCQIHDFVTRISQSHRIPHTRAGQRFHVATDRAAHLTVDPPSRAITLALPEMVAMSADQALIAVLQAMARGVSAVHGADSGLALLHGCALTLDLGADHSGGDAGTVAVLDGGLGQGKTSLTMGLAAACGRLLVDEFAFVRLASDEVRVLATPYWPWHLRDDMRPHLAPEVRAEGALLFADDLRPCFSIAECRDAALRLILVPDQGLAPGRTVPVAVASVRDLLRPAVTDHARKLADPGLDHVSIFDTPAQVHVPDQDVSSAGSAEARRVLDALARVPAFRVGIGAPGDLPASVAAARHAIAEVVA